MKTFNRSLSVLTASVLMVMSVPVFAQHAGDIHFAYEDNKIVIEDGEPGLLGPIFEGEFPTSGPFERWADDPGFGAESGSLVGGDIIDYDIVLNSLGYLVYWNGVTESFESTSDTITIGNNPSGTTVISASAVNRSGIGVIGASPTSGSDINGLHTHIVFQLSDGAALGAYGFLMQLTTDRVSLDDSDPFWLVFNYGLDHHDFHEAVEAFAAIPEPASLALLGAGGLLMLRRRR